MFLPITTIVHRIPWFRENVISARIFVICRRVVVELQWVRHGSQWSRNGFAMVLPSNVWRTMATPLRLHCDFKNRHEIFELIQKFWVVGEPVATPRRMRKLHGDSNTNAGRLQCECRATCVNKEYTIRSGVAMESPSYSPKCESCFNWQSVFCLFLAPWKIIN